MLANREVLSLAKQVRIFDSSPTVTNALSAEGSAGDAVGMSYVSDGVLLGGDVAGKNHTD